MSSSSGPKALHIALWVVQLLVALMFLGAGGTKLFMPIDELLKFNIWINWVPHFSVRLIGLAELLGAVGLILPSALRIQPKLTGIAALCLAVLMVGAAVIHFTHDDAKNAPASMVFCVVFLFIAWGRLVKAPIAPRG